MRIVLPGALPDPREARDLTPHLQKTAPTLVRWLELASPKLTAADPVDSGCTPFEKWQMQMRGFKPEPGQNFATGLGPLWSPTAADENEPVWLVELAHVSPSRDGAALIPAKELSITPEDSLALFDSVQALFAEAGFTLYPGGIHRWRVDLPSGYTPVCASPLLVSITSVNDWWPQDTAGRPWRRLVNEVQMLWFDHPVNKSRFERGQVPVNSLWLFGGARAKQISGRSELAETQVHTELLAASHVHDWGHWLSQLAELEASVFQPLGDDSRPALVLTGRDRIVELEPAALARWTRWLPGSRDTWRRWWSPQD